CGVLYTFGGGYPFVYVSEVPDADSLQGSLRKATRLGRGRGWLGIRRMCTDPSLGWMSVPGTALRRTRLQSRVVFKWLGRLQHEAIPTSTPEEGYSEGIQ